MFFVIFLAQLLGTHAVALRKCPIHGGEGLDALLAVARSFNQRQHYERVAKIPGIAARSDKSQLP